METLLIALVSGLAGTLIGSVLTACFEQRLERHRERLTEHERLTDLTNNLKAAIAQYLAVAPAHAALWTTPAATARPWITAMCALIRHGLDWRALLEGGADAVRVTFEWDTHRKLQLQQALMPALNQVITAGLPLRAHATPAIAQRAQELTDTVASAAFRQRTRDWDQQDLARIAVASTALNQAVDQELARLRKRRHAGRH